MSGEDTRSDAFKEFAGQWFEKLVEGTARMYGGKAADAVSVSPDEELKLWEKPTSPAAQRAYELGGSDDDAMVANTLWANAMRGEQIKIKTAMQQAGAMPDQIAQQLTQQGLTDSQIFAACRKHAYDLGKQNSHASPKAEAEYHKRMSEKARMRRMTGVADATAAPGAESTR